MTPDLEGVKDFFALEESGLKFVFDLNCEQFDFGTPKIELFFIANSTKK
mgnify:CR=1 FL=1